MLHKQTDKKAFTLIELLVVISIIALLVGILLPALGAARRTAQRAVCLSNQRQIGVAMMTYATGNKGLLPYTIYMENGIQTRWWHRLILDGAAVGSVDEGESSNLVCPSDVFPYRVNPTDPDDNVACSYGMNQFASIGDGVDAGGNTQGPIDNIDAYTAGQFWHTVDDMITPTDLLLTSEIYYGHLFDAHSTIQEISSNQRANAGSEGELSYGLWHRAEWGRHSGQVDDDGGKINILYADGHVASAGRGMPDTMGLNDAQLLGFPEYDVAKKLFWPTKANPASERY